MRMPRVSSEEQVEALAATFGRSKHRRVLLAVLLLVPASDTLGCRATNRQFSRGLVQILGEHQDDSD